jgi:hypothetical protein
LHGFVHAFHAGDGGDGAEGFFIKGTHAGADVGQDGGGIKEAAHRRFFAAAK